MSEKLKDPAEELIEQVPSDRTEEQLREAIAREMKQKRRVRSVYSKYMAAGIGVCFGGLLVLGLAMPLRPTYSAAEKRKLTERPEIHAASIWDGSYFTEFSTWFSDTFPFREPLLNGEAAMERLYGLRGEEIYGNNDTHADVIPTAAGLAPTIDLDGLGDTQEATASELSGTGGSSGAANAGGAGDTSGTSAQESGNTDRTGHGGAETFETHADGTLVLPDAPEAANLTGETAGNIYVTNNAGYEIYYFNQEGTTAYASMINTVRKLLPEDVALYDMMVPNSFGVELPADVQEALGSSNMRLGFQYTESMIDPSVHMVNVFDTLVDHKDAYIYFHTDHHWTQLGAYYAYRKFCEAKGFTPHELTDFKTEQAPGFYGTFYFATNRAQALKDNPDTIEAWIPNGQNDMQYVDKDGRQLNGHVINDAAVMNAGNKYNCFILGDNPFTEIHNPEITDGSAIVLVKESYGNCFVPWLVDHYQDVYVVDYRYYKDNLLDFIKEHKVRDVLFLNNEAAVSKSASAKMLGMFRK